MKPIFIVPWGISGLLIKYSMVVIISATPALLSAPSKVVPSVVIIVSPKILG